MRRYSVKIGGKERIVELDELDGGKLRASVDGVVRDIDARLCEPGLWSLMEGGAQTIAAVDGAAPKLTVAVTRPGADPIVIAVEIGAARSAGVAALIKRPDAVTGAATALRSPMPGRVVKILVKVGDRVTAGQAAVVVEAMKMENELRAARAGTVKELRCAEGTAVEAGQDLIVIG